MLTRSRAIRSRRNRRKIEQEFDLQITSLLDILVILLVFLLKSSVATMTNFNLVSGIQLPESQSTDIPPDSLTLIISPESMTFDNERVLDFIQTAEQAEDDSPTYVLRSKDLDEGGRRIVPLYDALLKAREREEVLRSKSEVRDQFGNPLPFTGQIAIQADKRIDYQLLRKVMYTAASAGYRLFRFYAMKSEG